MACTRVGRPARLNIARAKLRQLTSGAPQK
jgi:hypothetical protein